MPRPAQRAWARLAAAVRGRGIYLFLDYDGTLARIGAKSGRKPLSAGRRTVLRRLERVLDGRLAIISGRSLGPLKALVGLPELTCGGNHGLELSGPGWSYACPLPVSIRRLLVRSKRRLLARLKPYPKVWLEDKGATLSVQCREAPPGAVAGVERILHDVLGADLRARRLRLGLGKKVFEIFPPLPWDKGRAALWLLNRESCDSLPVFIGDDLTDENAFRVLRARGVTIRVGSPDTPTAAEFLLPGIPAVWDFLSRLTALEP